MRRISREGVCKHIPSVQTPEEYEEVHFPQARLVSVDELRNPLEEPASSQKTAAYAHVCIMWLLAARILLQH